MFILYSVISFILYF